MKRDIFITVCLSISSACWVLALYGNICSGNTFSAVLNTIAFVCSVASLIINIVRSKKSNDETNDKTNDKQ